MENDLILYYAPTPNGWKITILLEEANIDYKLVLINIAAGDQFTKQFLQISPNGRIPAIVHTKNSKQVSVFESGAIMIYLAQNFPQQIAKQFFPNHLQKEIFEWLFWLNAGLGPIAGQLSHFTYYAPRLAQNHDHSYSLKRYTNEYLRLISVLNQRLKDNFYVAGDVYTIADMAIWPWVKPFKRWIKKSLKDESFIYADRWYEEIKIRPGVIKGLNVSKELAILGQNLRDSKDQLDEKTKQNLFGYNRTSKL